MRNWAGNYAYRARRIHRPTSVEEAQAIVRAARRVRALGSRHSFNGIADTTGGLVSLAGLPRVADIDRLAGTVTVDGGARYGDVCGALHEAGLALHNLASLPHISIAGACATGTHGSGDRSGGLATAVTGLEMIRADGELEAVGGAAGDVPLDAAAVSLGSLGIVVRLTLRVEPTYLVRQDVFEDLPIDAFAARFAEITAMADSASCFTTWGGPVLDQVWLKRRVRDGDGPEPPGDLFGARPAAVERHPIRRMSPAACTPQLGVAGPWHERLPHFRMTHTPSSGDELQSEYLVPREHAVDAFLALDRLRERIAPLVQVSEVRTVAADDLWLSPASGRASAAFHFTWRPDVVAVMTLLPAIEAALARFEPRPHWGKLFAMRPDEVRARYARLPAFVALAERLDPGGKLRNVFVGRYLFGA